MIVPTISVAPKVAEAFRTGRGVPQKDYSPEMFDAIQRGSAPRYKNQLVQKWIPAMPQVGQRLKAGGSAADVGCGSGMAAITLAKAFPQAKIWGYDNHAGSIQRAKLNAKAAGVGKRVKFITADAKKLPKKSFDFVSTFDVVHDSVNPVGLMKAIRKSLKPDGSYLMLEMNCSPNVQENINPVGRLLYAVSTLYCMTTSLAQNGAGIGAVMGEPKARQLAQNAGFKSFRKLPIQDPFLVLTN